MGARRRHGRADRAKSRDKLLPPLPRGGGAGRATVDRRDPCGPDGGCRCGSPRSPQAVPELSDRLLSERMKELEARGMVERTVITRPAAAGRVRAVPDGPRARAGAGRARALGQPRGWRRTASVCRPLGLTLWPCSVTSRRSMATDGFSADRQTTSRALVAGAQHPIHPPLVHRHPRAAQGVLDQRHRARPTRSRAGWASTARRSPGSTRSRSRT